MKFFTCQMCDRRQLAYSRAMRNGLTIDQAQNLGWRIALSDYGTLCPFCVKKEIERLEQLEKEKLLLEKDKRLQEIEQLRTERIEELEQLAKDEGSKDAKKGSKKKKG